MIKGIVFVATSAHTPTPAPTAEDHTHTVGAFTSIDNPLN